MSTRATINDLAEGSTYFFVATAYNVAGLESLPSNEVSVTVTSSTPSSIWPASAAPQKVDGGADKPVEVGVKFRSDMAGMITGIRFYKAAANTGTHVGSLWTSTGTRLASATFTGETASGWQYVAFSSPVSVNADTVYIASYHCPAGHYSADENYFATNGVDNAPLHFLASGVSGGNGVYAYGPAGSFPRNTWKAANYWVDVVFEAVTISPLTSIVVTPSNPNVLTGSTQQYMATGTYGDGSTKTLTSQITWSSSNTGVATISANGLATAVNTGTTTITGTSGGVSGSSTLTVQASPLAVLTASLPNGSQGTAYTTTIQANGGTLPWIWSLASGLLPSGLTLNTSSGAISGTPTVAGTFNFTVRVSDSSTPVRTATQALSVTVAASLSMVSIWPTSAAPQKLDGGVDKPVELGVKFRSDVAGMITGIRFYKAAANTGTHVGSLWTSTGTLLASAIFTGETASGWQQVAFSSPVPVSADTVYIASYHCPAGHYSADENYFATNGVDNAPLHFLASGVSGGNGVYAYGPAGSFPRNTWKAANYWVDVVFNPRSGPDTTPPTVTSVLPQTDSGGVALQPVVKATFSEPIDASTMNTNTVLLRNAAKSLVSATVTYNSENKTVSLMPHEPLDVGSPYTVTVKGGDSGVTDLAGNQLAVDFIWSFTTVTYGALAGGPGGPVLVITDQTNSFSQYYAEILLAEGLNHFAIKDIHDVSPDTLATIDVVILGAIPLTANQVSMLSDWVGSGGNLIAMRPDKKLAPLLGLTYTGSTLSEAYLRIDNSSGPGAGIVGETIQYHGTADLYALTGATNVAWLYSNAHTSTASPAVTIRDVGSNGGQAAAFTFDLARSIVLSRQGNPAWIGQERDGTPPLRSSDLFYGPAIFDPQPDWIDLAKVAIPQADEKQRLLANMILVMNADRNLLPRFWYFPNDHEAAVVMTGDDHANNATKGRFDNELALSSENESLDDWGRLRSTSYIFVNDGALSDIQAAAYTAAGFELALHLNTSCRNFTTESLDALLTQQLAQWHARYPSLGKPVTSRTHCIAWSGYTITAEVEAKHGIRLDTNYYFWPAKWVLNRPGFMTGSGMPMRFSTAEGAVLDVYQAATQMTDESGQSYPFTVEQLLDKALGPEKFYGAFVANMHTDSATTPEWASVVLAALDRGVPVISARQLLIWTEARNSSCIKDLQSSDTALSFSVKAGTDARGLKVMVPLPEGLEIGSVTHNGGAAPYSLRVVKGIQYAFVDALDGTYRITFSEDSGSQL